jgi:hypothetical protein
VQSDGKRNLSKHLNATEAALADKIRMCQEAKTQLDRAILDVDLELQHLTRTSAKLQKLHARRRAALNLSEHRLKVGGRSLLISCGVLCFIRLTRSSFQPRNYSNNPTTLCS